MKRLYTPWRSSYAQDAGKTKQPDTTQENCVFCIQLKDPHNDAKNFILMREKYHAIFLNKYPYNAGHVMVIPYTHTPELNGLSPEARIELIELTNACCIIVEQTLTAHGINVGINLGKSAGAGIPSHLHLHVLPRYDGDTNFLPTLADTKIVSFDLAEMYQHLKPAFDAIDKL